MKYKEIKKIIKKETDPLKKRIKDLEDYINELENERALKSWEIDPPSLEPVVKGADFKEGAIPF